MCFMFVITPPSSPITDEFRIGILYWLLVRVQLLPDIIKFLNEINYRTINICIQHNYKYHGSKVFTLVQVYSYTCREVLGHVSLSLVLSVSMLRRSRATRAVILHQLAKLLLWLPLSAYVNFTIQTQITMHFSLVTNEMYLAVT